MHACICTRCTYLFIRVYSLRYLVCTVFGCGAVYLVFHHTPHTTPKYTQVHNINIAHPTQEGRRLGTPRLSGRGRAQRRRKGAQTRARTRPKGRRAWGHPRNLSISVRGGKETNTDFRSSGERKGRRPRRTCGGVQRGTRREVKGRGAREGASPVPPAKKEREE